jgi:hypothetical protein
MSLASLTTSLLQQVVGKAMLEVDGEGWREKHIGIATDGARNMTGRHSGDCNKVGCWNVAGFFPRMVCIAPARLGYTGRDVEPLRGHVLLNSSWFRLPLKMATEGRRRYEIYTPNRRFYALAFARSCGEVAFEAL